MRYDSFLFDWDGCLGQTLEIWLSAYRETFQDYNLNPTTTEIASQFGDWQGPRKLGLKGEDYNSFINKLEERATQKSRTVELYPGARELLNKLRAQHKNLALLTSSLRPIIQMGLKHNGIENYFDVIITAEETTNHKPHPEIIEAALSKMNTSKTGAVMIGDSSKDIDAAANAGIDSILIHPKSHDLFYDLEELKSHHPTHCLSGFEEMTKFLEE